MHDCGRVVRLTLLLLFFYRPLRDAEAEAEWQGWHALLFFFHNEYAIHFQMKQIRESEQDVITATAD